MARINYDYVEEKVLYDSGEVEERLLNEYKNKNIPLESDNSFFYSVTPIRENIINWYPFKKQSKILEIGGGLGAITGALCNNAEKVVSVEYSKRRAENIYYRHIDRDNLEVIVGNINNIKFNEKYDYIVLIGVFEYAKRFFSVKNPFDHFIKVMKKLLKDDGVILIAIENRYGIKYFSGAFEDHYAKKYLGLFGYDNCDIKTFGKEELTDIILRNGFKYYKYYYPYPDYKMPYIIHTDERTPLDTELSSLMVYKHDQNQFDFDYRKVISGINKNNQYGFFANSFLVEITNNKKNLSNIIYAKTSYDRNDEYQIYTIQKDNKNFVKIPKNSISIKHLDHLYKTNNKIKELGFNVNKMTKGDNCYLIENIDGISLIEYIKNLVEEKDKDKIIDMIDKYAKFLKAFSTMRNIKKCMNNNVKNFYSNKKELFLKLNLVDLHVANIILKNNKFFIIDQEWESKFDIPLKYMLYFSIYYLFLWIPNFANLFKKYELYKKYNISNTEIKMFNEMSKFIFEIEFNSSNNVRMKKTIEQNSFVVSEDLESELLNKLVAKEGELEQLNDINQNYMKEIALLKENNKSLTKEIEDIRNSKSMKITAPLRKTASLFKGKKK